MASMGRDKDSSNSIWKDKPVTVKAIDNCLFRQGIRKTLTRLGKLSQVQAGKKVWYKTNINRLGHKVIIIH